MQETFLIVTLWLGLAVTAALLASRLKLSTALVEICVGVAAATVASHFFGKDLPGSDVDWLRFLASTGAVLLTFLAIRAKWILFVLCGLGALAMWAGSEAVLPAYIAGMMLAGNAAKDNNWIRRMRTLTVGFLTPFYFLRAGSLVSVPSLVSAPLVFLALLAGKVGSKIFGLYPVIGKFRSNPKERWYYTLLMSTGLTFGTISALFGLSHGIVTPEQYSFLVAAVIASAVIPTMIAGWAFFPKHITSPERGYENQMSEIGESAPAASDCVPDPRADLPSAKAEPDVAGTEKHPGGIDAPE